MRARTTTITILLASALLAGCGGGGGSGGGVTAVSSAPAPTPAPTPAPAPAPTPAPTPADAVKGYGGSCDGFASPVTAYAISATMRIDHADRSTTPDAYIYSSNDLKIENLSEGLVYVYDPKTRNASTMQVSTKLYGFDQKDVVSSDASSISYRQGSRTLDVSCMPGSAISFQRYSADLRNPAIGVKETVFRSQMTGAVTPTTAETASGTYVSNISLEIFRTDVLDPALRTEAVGSVSVPLVFDKAAGTITGTFRIGGSEPMDLKVDITRQIGTRFTGTITASNGAKGEIDGGFYGAGGREIGFIVAFEKFGFHYAGAGSGKRG